MPPPTKYLLFKFQIFKSKPSWIFHFFSILLFFNLYWRSRPFLKNILNPSQKPLEWNPKLFVSSNIKFWFKPQFKSFNYPSYILLKLWSANVPYRAVPSFPSSAQLDPRTATAPRPQTSPGAHIVPPHTPAHPCQHERTANPTGPLASRTNPRRAPLHSYLSPSTTLWLWTCGPSPLLFPQCAH